MPRIHELLQTKKRGEQEQRVQQLLQMASMPVMAVMVQFDPRNNKLDVRVVGADQPAIEDIKFVLRKATDMLTEQETRVKMEQEQEQPVNMGPLPEVDVSEPGEGPPEVRQHAREYFVPDQDETEDGDPDPLDHNPT